MMFCATLQPSCNVKERVLVVVGYLGSRYRCSAYQNLGGRTRCSLAGACLNLYAQIKVRLLVGELFIDVSM